MKHFLPILFAFIFHNGVSLACSKIHSQEHDKDTLIPFHVTLYSGDEAVEKYGIAVYKRENKYSADYIHPSFAGSTVTIWTVELDHNKIELCLQFMAKANSLPGECEELSSSVKYYEIAMGKDTIKIHGDCNWGSLDFFSLRDRLFKEKIASLERQEIAVVDSLNNYLIGKWYFLVSTKFYKKGDHLILTKSADKTTPCNWEFGNDYLFKSSCNSILDFTRSNAYSWHFENGKTYLNISPGMIIEKNGDRSIGNDGATFILDTLDSRKLMMSYLWR